MTGIHIFSVVFGLGWMVFIFFILRPVAGGRAQARSQSKKVEVIMYVVDFSSGCVAAYLGITIGG